MYKVIVCIRHIAHTLCLRKMTLMLHTIISTNINRQILVIFGRDVAETVCY